MDPEDIETLEDLIVSTVKAGFTQATVTVPVFADNAVEGNETFTVRITGVTFGSIARADAVATIVDNDFAPTMAQLSTPGLSRSAAVPAPSESS